MAEIGGFNFNPADIARLGLTLGGTAFAADKVGGTSVPNIPYIPFQQALGQIPEVGLRSGEARFNIGGPDQGLTADPAIRQMREEAVAGLQGFTPGGISNIPRIRGLEQDISQLRSNRSPFVEARVAPTLEAQAERFGALSEELGRTGVRGSLREQQLNKFQTQASRAEAEQRALAEQESLDAINRVRQIQLGEQQNLTAQQRNQVAQNQLGADFAIQKANLGLDAAQQQFAQDFAGLELGTDLIKNIFDTAARISINSGIQSIQSGVEQDEADLRLTDIIGKGINEVLDTFAGGKAVAGGAVDSLTGGIGGAGLLGGEAVSTGTGVLGAGAAPEAALGPGTGLPAGELSQGLTEALAGAGVPATTISSLSPAAIQALNVAAPELALAGGAGLDAAGLSAAMTDALATGSTTGASGLSSALASAGPLAAVAGIIAFDILSETRNPGKDLTNRVDEFFQANPTLNSGDPEVVLNAAKTASGGPLSTLEAVGLLSRKNWIPREFVRNDPDLSAAVDAVDPVNSYLSGVTQGGNTILRYAGEGSKAYQGNQLGLVDWEMNQLQDGDPMANLPGLLEQRNELVNQLGIDPADEFISSEGQISLLT